MASFKEDWKKAKADFTTATQSKKPSKTFLGVFNKGSGIESALESADKAKSAGDLQKAMASFKKAFDEYGKTLDKATTDPKVTPAADKAAYAEAVKKLKAALQGIYDSASATMQSVVDAGAKTKDKVNPAELKKQADAVKTVKEHTARRLALAKSLVKTQSDYKSKGVEAAAANTVKQLQAAKAAKAGRNTMGADVAAQASARFAEEAGKLLDEIIEDWTKRSTTGAMIDLRQDSGSAGDLPPDQMAPLKKDAAAAWHATEKVQREIQAYIGKLRTVVVTAKSAAESAEAFRMTGASPDVYAKRVAEIKSRLEKLASGSKFAKYAGKLGTVRNRQKELAESPTVGPNDLESRKKMWGQLKGEHELAKAESEQIIEELKETHKRLNAIPRDDQAVSEAADKVTELLDKIRAMADKHVAETQLLLNELDTYLAKK